MKLFNKTNSPYLSKLELRKIFLAISVMTLILYSIAMIVSLCGSDIFIVKYQNESMDRIEAFMTKHSIQSLLSWMFATLEFSIITSFITKKRCKWYYVVGYYIIPVIIAFIFPQIPSTFYTILTIFFYVIVILIDSFVFKNEHKGKKFGFEMLMLLISQVVAYTLQLMIYIIKAGYFSVENHRMTMSAHFIYAIEYDIALSVLLFTIALYIDKEKGDSGLWVTYHTQSGFSQTSKTKSQRLSLMNLSKKQKNRLIWLYVRLYLIQVLGFTFIMVLPFLMGKVLEFLVMYLAFAVIRYILGFKYSLHFKNEFLCISVGAVVFGIFTLAVPFFYVEIIIAVLLGSGLATFLHLSYKYKGFWLFAKMAKPDKFATLFVLFDGNLEKQYVLRTCKFAGISDEDSKIVFEYVEGNKLSYISHKYNYSIKTLDRKLNDAIDLLNM